MNSDKATFIADSICRIKGLRGIIYIHFCDNNVGKLVRREENKKPVYWCSSCGTIIEGSVAMVIALKESEL